VGEWRRIISSGGTNLGPLAFPAPTPQPRANGPSRDQRLTNDIGESNANIRTRTTRKKPKNGGPGRSATFLDPPIAYAKVREQTSLWPAKIIRNASRTFGSRPGRSPAEPFNSRRAPSIQPSSVSRAGQPRCRIKQEKIGPGAIAKLRRSCETSLPRSRPACWPAFELERRETLIRNVMWLSVSEPRCGMKGDDHE
jgi:hypothetical protein